MDASPKLNGFFNTLSSNRSPKYNFRIFLPASGARDLVVIPAKAGIQKKLQIDWIPTFAGMTTNHSINKPC